MASVAPPAFTDCLHCHSLCVGNAILPCGHVVCRKCLRGILEKQKNPTCPEAGCERRISRGQEQTIRETIDQLESDQVLADLVNERFVQQSDTKCHGCQNTSAKRLCLDCSALYCGQCFNGCCTKDHVAQDLGSITGSLTRAATGFQPPAGVSQSEVHKTASSRRSELKSALRIIGEVEEKIQLVKEDVDGKQWLLELYMAAGALQAGKSSVQARLEKLLELWRPPPLDTLKHEVKYLHEGLLCRQYSMRVRGDICSRTVTPPRRFLPVHQVSEPEEPNVNIPKPEKLRVINVGVNVQKLKGQDYRVLPPASGTETTSQTINIGRVRDFKIETHSISLNIGDRLATLEVVTEASIKDAVKDALLAKVTWDDDWERKLKKLKDRHEEEMRREVWKMEKKKWTLKAALEEARRWEDRAKKEKNRLEEKRYEAKTRSSNGQKDREKLEHCLQQMHKELRAARERVSTLEKQVQAENEEKEKCLAALTQRHDDEKKRLHEQVMTFVIRVEEVHRQLLASRHLDEKSLSDVIHRLFQRFHIRLLGADCGLRFLLEAPVSQWAEVVEKQLEVQATLSNLIPEDARRGLTWAEVTPIGPTAEDIDLRLGQPLPVQVLHPGSDERVVIPHSFDPLTANPRRTLFVDNSQLVTQGDKYCPWITSLVITDRGLLVMADNTNKKVKLMVGGAIVSALPLGVKPGGLAILHDKLLAVASYADYIIHLIDVTASRTLTVAKQITVAKQYRGVGCGGKEGTLIVSCGQHKNQLATVDVISRKGELLRTVIHGDGMCQFWYLCVVGGVVLVSDRQTNCVLRVELTTGRVVDTYTDARLLRDPHQMSADRWGNLYIASFGAHRVVVIGVDGRRRTLLNGQEHGEGEHARPVSVTVTDTGVVVGWSNGNFGSVVTGFDLK